MKYFRVLWLLLPFVILSCSEENGGDEPQPTEGVGEFTITGAISKTANNYVSEFVGTISSVANLSSLQISIGNVGQTEDAILFDLIRQNNATAFTPGTYTYSGDENADFLIIARYAGLEDFYIISGAATSLLNEVKLTSVQDNKVEGTFEFNLQASSSTDLIKVTGKFEATGETLRN